MMPTAIRPGLHLCDFGDCVVGLDLAVGGYRLFRGETGACMSRFLAGNADQEDVERLQRNAVVSDEARPKVPSFVLAPNASLIGGGAPLGVSGLATAVLAQFAARRAVRRLSAPRLFERLAIEADSARSGDIAEYRPTAAAFHLSRRLVTQEDQCLVRGVAMVTVLHRLGLRAHLVIGVKMPFAAHCWVQVGSTLLSDHIDDVRSYRPIFIL